MPSALVAMIFKAIILPLNSQYCHQDIKSKGTARVCVPLQDAGQGADGDAAVRRESRAARRRPGRLRAAAEASCAADPAEAAAGVPPRRLETHIWHAKRFQMQLRCAFSSLYNAPSDRRPDCGQEWNSAVAIGFRVGFQTATAPITFC